MTSARDRAAALRKRDVPAAAPAEPEPAPAARRVADPDRKVRQTVDLTHRRHLDLARWRNETAAELEIARLSTQEVLAVLVDLVLEDEQVARRLRRRLEQRAGES